MKGFRRTVAVILCGAAWGALATSSAFAQSAKTKDSSGRLTGNTSRQRFDIAPGALSAALNEWSRQTGQSIVFRADDIIGKTTNGAKGRKDAYSALADLLDGTGFTMTIENGAVAVVRAASVAGDAGGATPDILVTARNSWSLNTGIKRSQDDSQPFIVMTGEEIRRSGSPNLETFLRDRLNVNSAPGTSAQTKGDQFERNATNPFPPAGRGTSQVNLRGLGARDTLILVDGRPQPGVNLGDGNLGQAQLTGIPISAIERIEVLASSASGIYGAGASGGVINIVLKRDYTGGEITATYRNTTDFAAGDGQIDFNYGVPLEGGRTRVTMSGSWQKGLPLLNGDRERLNRVMRERIAANLGNSFQNFYGPPIGSAVNYTSNTGTLQLKPEYGGQILPSGFGTVPAEYAGITAGGVAGLLPGVGTFNRDTPDTALAPGRLSPLIYGSKLLSGSLTVRREFNSWLTGYIGLNASRSESMSYYSRGPDQIELQPDSPSNPFTSAIRLTLGGISEQAAIKSEQRYWSVIGGAIVKLPYGWQAAIDGSYSRSWFRGDALPPLLTQATTNGLVDGTQDVLRDVRRFPLSLQYNPGPFYTVRKPGISSNLAPSLRVSGPLPISLPGGRPEVTVSVSHVIDRSNETASSAISGVSLVTTYNAPAWQTATSVYGEIVLPLLSDANHVPLFRQLELRFSARSERSRGNGADQIDCGVMDYDPAVFTSPYLPCPGPADVVRRSITRNSRTDPSVSFRWFPIASMMFRGSYTTGYLPPQLSQLVPTLRPGAFLPPFTDALRGGELIGTSLGFFRQIDVITGGNPNVRPERSRTVSFGTVLTPSFLPGFRFSADWTRINKSDIYFPASALIVFNPQAQAQLDTLLRVLPDRAIRGPASDGFAVGKITALDLSLVNLNSLSTEAIDFVVGYNGSLFGGTIDFNARATYARSLKVQPFPDEPNVDYAGVVTRGFAAVGGNAALKWRGSGGVSWTKDALTVGWQSRFFDRYRQQIEGEALGQGSPFVASQLYHDMNVSYRFSFGSTLTAGINNVFNKYPSFDAEAFPLYYSGYGDPRLRNFYMSVSKSF